MRVEKKLHDLITKILEDGVISEDLLGKIVERLGKIWMRRRRNMMTSRGMICGNCEHHQEDKHCALYPRGSPTESDNIATQQQYCNWRGQYGKVSTVR